MRYFDYTDSRYKYTLTVFQQDHQAGYQYDTLSQYPADSHRTESDNLLRRAPLSWFVVLTTYTARQYPMVGGVTEAILIAKAAVPRRAVIMVHTLETLVNTGKPHVLESTPVHLHSQLVIQAWMN